MLREAAGAGPDREAPDDSEEPEEEPPWAAG